MSADVALSEKSPYLGGAWVRWGLSNNPDSMERCRFEISGFHTVTDNPPLITYVGGINLALGV